MFGYLDLQTTWIEAIDAATITSIYPARGSTEGKLDPTHNLITWHPALSCLFKPCAQFSACCSAGGTYLVISGSGFMMPVEARPLIFRSVRGSLHIKWIQMTYMTYNQEYNRGELLGSSARRTHGTRRWCMWGDLASEWGGFVRLTLLDDQNVFQGWRKDLQHSRTLYILHSNCSELRSLKHQNPTLKTSHPSEWRGLWDNSSWHSSRKFWDFASV